MSIRVCQPQQFSNRARYFVPSCHFSAKMSQSNYTEDKNIIMMTAHQQVQLFSAYEGQHREQARTHLFPSSLLHIMNDLLQLRPVCHRNSEFVFGYTQGIVPGADVYRLLLSHGSSQTWGGVITEAQQLQCS